jgi:hypothetical protein
VSWLLLPYIEQGRHFEIEEAMCQRHSSVEFGGACSAEHKQQCEKYAPEAFSSYEPLMRLRHTLPAIADSIASLRKDIGASIFNAMEVSLTSVLLRRKQRQGVKLF